MSTGTLVALAALQVLSRRLRPYTDRRVDGLKGSAHRLGVFLAAQWPARSGEQSEYTIRMRYACLAGPEQCLQVAVMWPGGPSLPAGRRPGTFNSSALRKAVAVMICGGTDQFGCAMPVPPAGCCHRWPGGTTSRAGHLPGTSVGSKLRRAMDRDLYGACERCLSLSGRGDFPVRHGDADTQKVPKTQYGRKLTGRSQGCFPLWPRTLSNDAGPRSGTYQGQPAPGSTQPHEHQ